MTTPRSRGRSKADHRPSNRTIAIGAATAMGAIATGIATAIHFGWLDRLFRPHDGHAAPDLAADAATPGSGRAPTAFRPDPTAPVSAAEREALRPATGPGPSLTEPAGSMGGQTAPAEG